MQAGFLEITVNVTFNCSVVGVSESYGSGETNKYWPMNQRQLETKFGKVLIVKDDIRLRQTL